MNRNQIIDMFNTLLDKQFAKFEKTHVYTSIRYYLQDDKIKSRPYGKGFPRISGQAIVVDIPKSFWEKGYNERTYRKYLAKFAEAMQKYHYYDDRDVVWSTKNQPELF